MTPRTTPLTAAEVRELLDYNPETGVLTWRSRDRSWFTHDRSYNVWNAQFAGTTAGSVSGEGYLAIKLLTRGYKAHRVIWLWMTGAFPSGQIDHIDHDRLNNRWTNLRNVSAADNSRNHTRHRTNTSGIPGVGWLARNRKWMARVGDEYLGVFDTFDEAVKVRRAAELAAGYHKNHGAPK